MATRNTWLFVSHHDSRVEAEQQLAQHALSGAFLTGRVLAPEQRVRRWCWRCEARLIADQPRLAYDTPVPAGCTLVKLPVAEFAALLAGRGAVQQSILARVA